MKININRTSLIFFLLIWKTSLSQTNIIYRNEKINSFNESGQKTGKWISFLYSDTSQHLLSEGYFKEGIKIGQWKYYTYSYAMHIRIVFHNGDGSFFIDFNQMDRIEVNKDSSVIKWIDKRSSRKDDIFIICKRRDGKYIYKRYHLKGWLQKTDSINTFDDAYEAVLQVH